MMKANVIEVTEKTCDKKVEVCVRLERDEDGRDFVKISAWLCHPDDGQFLYHENQFDFGDARNNFQMCERFVEDFSKESAQEFVDSFEF